MQPLSFWNLYTGEKDQETPNNQMKRPFWNKSSHPAYSKIDALYLRNIFRYSHITE